MRLPEAQVELLALDGGLKADALDFEFLFETFANAGDHIGDQRPGETVQALLPVAIPPRRSRETLLPSTRARTAFGRFHSSLPLGPSTVTAPSAPMSTFTFGGHFNGFSADS